MTNTQILSSGLDPIRGTRHPVMWLLAAAGSLAAAEVYYVRPELAAIAPSLRLSDLAIGLMSAVNQFSTARDEIPLWCKARAVTFYLLGVLAMSRVLAWVRRLGSPAVVAPQAGSHVTARVKSANRSITEGAKPCSRRISNRACARMATNSVRPPSVRPTTSSTTMRTGSTRGF